MGEPKSVEVRDNETAWSASREGGKSNDVVSSVDSNIHVDNSTRETRVGDRNKQICATERGIGENHEGSCLINVRGIN